MAQAYDAIIATIVVASDATSVTKSMVKSTTWRQGTSGDWNSTDCTLTAGNTYQFRTPLSGMSSSSTAILPNIKASVTVAWDTSATPISAIGNYFMYCYAYSCSSLTSLSVPDTSGITTVGARFMSYYAYGCSGLTSLSVPDTSGITSVGDYFMYCYAYSCSSLTSLSVPDTSGITSVGNYFMSFYAYNCSNLTSLSVPDTSGLTSVGTNFMGYYARGCSNLTSLSVPDTSGLTSVGDYFMYSYAQGCSSLTSLSVPDTSGLTSVGNYFMYLYAYNCSNLTSLSVPDTSGLTSVGTNFMGYYARGCSSLTSLSVPDTSGLTSVGDYFMYSYARGCSSLTSLSVPDTSGLTSVGDYFMRYYAYNCSNLTSLILPHNTGWFGSNNIGWSVPSERLGYLYGYTDDSTSQTAWQGLTTEGKTLYTNYIRAADHVLLEGGTEANSERKLYVKGGDYYSKESATDLESDDTPLATQFSEQEYTTVRTDDDNYVDLQGTAQYMKFLFKELNENESNEQKFDITWKGKSSLAPASATVYLQVYNRTSGLWETLDSDSSSSADTKFTLEGSKATNLSDYYDQNYVISARVYQDVVV